MPLEPTWDLFIGVFIFVIISYSFIVGINGTLKVLLSTYIGILMVEGLYTFILKLFPNGLGNEVFAGTSGEVLLKISLFIVSVVVLTTKGRFEPDFQSERFYMFESAFIPVFGFFCASLIVGTIMLYAFGGGIFSGLDVLTSVELTEVSQKSILLKYILEYFSLLFTIPALCLLGLSFLEND